MMEFCFSEDSAFNSTKERLYVRGVLLLFPLSQPRYHHIPQRLQYELHFAGVGVVADDGVFVRHHEAALGGGT